MEVVQIGFVDDQRLFRIGFARILKSFRYVNLLIVAESGADLLSQIESKGLPDVVIIDLDMPGQNGIEVAKNLKDKYPTIKPIILTGHDDDELIIRLIKDNFCAYLHKDAHEDEVEKAIYEVFEKGKFNSNRTIEALNRTNATSDITCNGNHKNEILTSSEIDIVKLICKGFRDAEIADKLNKGLRTIQNQKLILRKKIQADTMADIINYAVENGLVDGAGYKAYKRKGSSFS